MPPYFVLVGAGAYVTHHHIRAIKAVGGEIAAAYDPKRMHPDLPKNARRCSTKSEIEAFVNGWETSRGTLWAVILSPNPFHFSQIHWAWSLGLPTICEKPLVVDSSQLDDLELALANQPESRLAPIFQLRFHPLRKRLEDHLATKAQSAQKNQRRIIDLTYITARDTDFFDDWRGDVALSGGIAADIGIHFFDLLVLVLGPVRDVKLSRADRETLAGTFLFDQAEVTWLLSVDAQELPQQVLAAGKMSRRGMTFDGDFYDLETPTDDLHLAQYQAILSGQCLTPADVKPAIQLAETVNHLWQSGTYPTA